MEASEHVELLLYGLVYIVGNFFYGSLKNSYGYHHALYEKGYYPTTFYLHSISNTEQ